MSSTAPVVPNKEVTLPAQTELLKAMQTSDTSEGAQYLSARIHQLVESSKHLNRPEIIETAKKVVAAVDEYAQFVEFRHASRSQLWSGQAPEVSSFKNMQMGIAEQALSKIGSKDVRFDFAISQDGHFVRGYASPDKDAPPMEPTEVQSLDRLFNAWLAEDYQIATENGYFYKTDSEGNLLKNQKMSMAEVDEIMANSAKEFKDYLHEKGGIELTGKQREYPGEQRLDELRRAAANKAAERVKETMKMDTAEKPQSEVPVPDESAGMGRK
ncbi:MAG: hypothetical protein HYX60_06405 [Legionella longbeachae]|nr:hypothetical protein [Legionella longbeachae]